MPRFSKVIALALAFCLVSTAVFACHSNYFEEIFTKVKKAHLDKEQLVALLTLKKNYFAADHQKIGRGSCDRAHDQHQTEFVAAAAGILDDGQFKTVIGQQKTEVQKLRYEVNQLKKDMAEIKALIKQLQLKS